MTKSMINDYPYNVINYPSFGAELESSDNGIMYRNQGIDTIELIAKYETVIKMLERLELQLKSVESSDKLYKKVNYEIEEDKKKRLKVEQFSPIVERIDLPKVNPKDRPMFIKITRNSPLLFDIATKRKRAKDSYCLITFAGLHQPTKRIESEAVKIIDKFLRRKTFTLHSVDIAIDTTDNQSIDYKRKGAFKDNLMPLSNKGVIFKGSSLYINNLDHENISRVLYYNKYQKQLTQQGKEKVAKELNGWKRLEITLTFDVLQTYNKSFTHYIESLNFINDLYEIQEVATKAGIKSYDHDYLEYQLSSFIDNRFMNNRESREQFNSVQSLERFKQSEFKRYVLPF